MSQQGIPHDTDSWDGLRSTRKRRAVINQLVVAKYSPETFPLADQTVSTLRKNVLEGTGVDYLADQTVRNVLEELHTREFVTVREDAGAGGADLYQWTDEQLESDVETTLILKKGSNGRWLACAPNVGVVAWADLRRSAPPALDEALRLVEGFNRNHPLEALLPPSIIDHADLLDAVEPINYDDTVEFGTVVDNVSVLSPEADIDGPAIEARALANWKVVCVDCGSGTTRNGQDTVRGPHDFTACRCKCRNCGQERKVPQQHEYDRIRAEFDI